MEWEGATWVKVLNQGKAGPIMPRHWHPTHEDQPQVKLLWLRQPHVYKMGVNVSIKLVWKTS